VAPHGRAVDRATVRQKKTGQPVRFEMTEETRQAIDDYIRAANKKPGQHLFASRRGCDRAITTRQVDLQHGVRPCSAHIRYAKPRPHSFTAAPATCAVQLLLGHKNIESTVRYLGIEVDYALAIAEQIDV